MEQGVQGEGEEASQTDVWLIPATVIVVGLGWVGHEAGKA